MTHFNSYEFRSVLPTRVMPPEPAQVSPAIRARQQKLILRRAELVEGGMDVAEAAALALVELEGHSRRKQKPSTVPQHIGGKRPCVWDGVEYPSRNEAARSLGITENALRIRLLRAGQA